MERLAKIYCHNQDRERNSCMKKIRIGIFGLGRGMTFAKSIMLCNGEIVAVCDKQEKKIRGNPDQSSLF